MSPRDEAAGLIAELKARSVTLHLNGRGDIYVRPRAACDETLRRRIRALKSEIAAMLSHAPEVTAEEARLACEFMLVERGWKRAGADRWSHPRLSDRWPFADAVRLENEHERPLAEDVWPDDVGLRSTDDHLARALA